MLFLLLTLSNLYIYDWIEICENSDAAHGLVFTLAVTLALVISVNHLNTYAEPEATIEICINGKCKMVSNHDGYHSQKTCINKE